MSHIVPSFLSPPLRTRRSVITTTSLCPAFLTLKVMIPLLFICLNRSRLSLPTQLIAFFTSGSFLCMFLICPVKRWNNFWQYGHGLLGATARLRRSPLQLMSGDKFWDSLEDRRGESWVSVLRGSYNDCMRLVTVARIVFDRPLSASVNQRNKLGINHCDIFDHFML